MKPACTPWARPPRPADEALLSRFLRWRIGLVAALMVAGTFGLCVHAQAGGQSLEQARTVTARGRPHRSVTRT